MDKADYQYDMLTGIGVSAKPSNGPAESKANGNGVEVGIEEAYISLLDNTEDAGEPKVEEGAKSVELPPELPNGNNAAAAESEAAVLGRKELPWTRSSKQIRSPSLRLHNEIVEFCRFLEPTVEEDAARQDALKRITEVVQSMFPHATVSIFGSYVTGLYLPTSDMDLVVVHSGCTDIPRALRGIGNTLVAKGMAKGIQVIPSAKVPIIKFDDISSGLAFDISFDVANGPKTAKLVTELMGSLAPMRHLVIVLKLFLQQREMNEVYQGGIGSYALLVMVANLLLQHRTRIPNKKSDSNPILECNLGLLLLDFFRLYGRTLKQDDVAISCRNGGDYFTKLDHPNFLQRDRMYFLAIEDPQDPDNDLAKGSWNISKVQKAFDFAYRQLSNPIEPSESNLERIIRLDAVLMSRAPAPASKPVVKLSDAKHVVKPPDADSGGKGLGKRKYEEDTTGVVQRFELELIDMREEDKRGIGARKERNAKHSKRGQASPARKKWNGNGQRERDYEVGDKQKRRRS